jgi:DNA-binding NarL/FixJ family response regulator
MGGLNGVQATAQICAAVPQTAVLILSMHRDQEHVAQALHAGASGYILKDAATEELAFALQAARRGEVYLSPAVSRPVLEGYLLGQVGGPDPLEGLTPRQREILKLIAEGLSTKKIATALGLSGKTVESHRAQLMRRLGIRDVAGLTRYAVRIGLVSPEG